NAIPATNKIAVNITFPFVVLVVVVSPDRRDHYYSEKEYPKIFYFLFLLCGNRYHAALSLNHKHGQGFMEFAYILSGLLVGFLVGLTGVGGGSLMTPLLVFLFGFAPTTAVGTDLLFASITKAGGVAVHHGKHRSVDWKIVRHLAMGSLPSALAVIFSLEYFAIPKDTIASVMAIALGFALILTALALLFRNRLMKASLESDSRNPARFGRWQTPATILVGVVLGVLVTLSSIGAGALGTVALFYLYPRLSTVRIVGTDLAHAIPLTAVAGLGHLHMGNVDFGLLGSLLVGSLPGIYVGSHLSARIPEYILRPALASVLMLIGVKFVWPVLA
ncbi:MAG: putative rane protein, partial [Proteobacteria bacterium]|nr:putative rane protein [Pseudomonadota bacterium]